MSAPLLSLASGVIPEASPLELIDAAAAAGYAAVGLWVEPERFSPDYLRQVKSALREHDLQLLDAEVVWIKPGALNPAHLHILDIAAELSADHVLVVSSDPDQQATIHKLTQLCDHNRDLRIVLEFGAFTEVRSLEQAREVIGAVNRPNLGMLIDALHWARSGGTLQQIESLPAQWLTYAQLCDASGPGPDMANRADVRLEAVDYRLLPGDGDLPLGDWLGALPDGLPLSLEIRSLSLRSAYPDFALRAQEVHQRTQAWLDNTKQSGLHVFVDRCRGSL
ncbi:sugar phosphate isomerase/epimerase family protein [Halopseudomonas bauzanensis]|uniref:sugar phosphate isomerase/epimerase family protein n=1 Tax=Halopseudomonas bauzanensis TaxID=653930 RepID=UPI002554FCEA|nr:sugar phosphate isomerase/epimerase [Halopseudomonas bauzanensis]